MSSFKWLIILRLPPPQTYSQGFVRNIIPHCWIEKSSLPGLEHSMTRLVRSCFWLGLLIYVGSFWLIAVAGPGVWTLRPPSIVVWVIKAFIISLNYLHHSHITTFFGDLTPMHVSGMLNGWINPVF